MLSVLISQINMYTFKKNYLILLFLSLLIFNSCAIDDSIPDDPISELNILTLGDSRVKGLPPTHQSYRYELWKDLIDHDWTIDFIGPEIESNTYPEYAGLEFDGNHGAYGGYTTLDMLQSLQEMLPTLETPDIVLLGIGGVDLILTGDVETAIANIYEIITVLQSNNPDVTIFLEQIAPGVINLKSQDILQDFNDAIGALPIFTTTTTSTVVSVDMATGWSNAFLADNVHYNELGAKVVADRYFDAIDEHVEQ
ncbi:GDSL-type esterase/lipase family protein [Dokdonia sp.]|uniref:SGNH/GDSL hydrolase family protein n=1 Tax=Dokdonia sp. TaxID=2024995 RepID=UPI0032667B8A